jgi:hypothetical protein
MLEAVFSDADLDEVVNRRTMQKFLQNTVLGRKISNSNEEFSCVEIEIFDFR